MLIKNNQVTIGKKQNLSTHVSNFSRFHCKTHHTSSKCYLIRKHMITYDIRLLEIFDYSLEWLEWRSLIRNKVKELKNAGYKNNAQCSFQSIARLCSKHHYSYAIKIFLAPMAVLWWRLYWVNTTNCSRATRHTDRE